jgi:hypothetical protein
MQQGTLHDLVASNHGHIAPGSGENHEDVLQKMHSCMSAVQKILKEPNATLSKRV